MIKTLIDNKHTSIAAGMYLGASIIATLGSIWFPQYKIQFDQTTAAVEKLALTYGLVMAGDAKKDPTVTT